MERGTGKVKTGLAQTLKGSAIMDVVNPEQAKIAQGIGTCAAMALASVSADIQAAGDVTLIVVPSIIAEVSKNLGEVMRGKDIRETKSEESLIPRRR